MKLRWGGGRDRLGTLKVLVHKTCSNVSVTVYIETVLVTVVNVPVVVFRFNALLVFCVLTITVEDPDTSMFRV